MESPSPSPNRGKGFTQLEMIEFAESLLEHLPINTMEWDRLQREKHETRSVSTLKQKWKSMLSRRKSFDAGNGNIMSCPLELTHVTKILEKMKRKKEHRKRKNRFNDKQLLYLEKMVYQYFPVENHQWGGIAEQMEYTFQQDLGEVSVEECIEAHRRNVTKQPGTGDPNCPEHVRVALRAQRRIITRSQADSYDSEDDFFAEHKKDMEDELAYQERERNEPTDPTKAPSSIVEKKTKTSNEKEKEIIKQMLEKSINKNLKKHIVECRTIKGAYGPIIGLCDKNTWRNWAWVTDNNQAYNDIYDSKINIDNLTFAINQTKTPQPLGIWEVTDSNLI